jgi:hypothetical protein
MCGGKERRPQPTNFTANPRDPTPQPQGAELPLAVNRCYKIRPFIHCGFETTRVTSAWANRKRHLSFRQKLREKPVDNQDM